MKPENWLLRMVTETGPRKKTIVMACLERHGASPKEAEALFNAMKDDGRLVIYGGGDRNATWGAPGWENKRYRRAA